VKNCDLHAGLLRDKVTVERLTLTPDGIGGSTQTWATLYQPWAAIYPATGWEKMAGMQLESPITHTIYIRYNADIKARDRIVHRGRVFNIRSVAIIEEYRIFMELKAEEGVA
jgi:SPP1 family predicted phage head-tail adaptor